MGPEVDQPIANQRLMRLHTRSLSAQVDAPPVHAFAAALNDEGMASESGGHRWVTLSAMLVAAPLIGQATAWRKSASNSTTVR